MNALVDHPDLVAGGRLRTLGAGLAVFTTGDLVDAVHVLRRGVVVVRTTTVDGEPAVVDVRGRGDLLDDTALLPERPVLHLDEARTLTEVELLQVPLSVMEALRDQVPEIGAAVVVQLSDQARRLSGVLVDLLGRSARARTARRLDELAEALWRSDLAGTPLHITQRDLAEFVGTTRATLNSELATLQDERAIVVERGRVTILDRDGLRRHS